MASVTAFRSQARHEQHGLSYWMDRVLKELQSVCVSPDPEAVHDLRVAIRRCRSLAAVMEEVDPHPAWPEMRKVARKLFRGLGDLRDAQVMDEWVKKLGEEGDPLRLTLQTSSERNELELRNTALRLAAKFDEKSWKRLQRTLRARARLVPPGSLAAECLALERFECATDLHARALRTEKPAAWHKLRIALKRFRYTVESLLPEHYAAWSDNLKRVQDLLGEVHDLDVLTGIVQKSARCKTPEMPGMPQMPEMKEALKSWKEIIHQHRHERIETYLQLTLGKTSLWHTWRHGLPRGERLEAASMARLRATARAMDASPRRTGQVSRLAQRLFDALARVHAAPLFAQRALRRTLRAAARLHGIARDPEDRSPQRAAQKFLLKLPVPPGWTNEEWELLAATVRYYRGAQPSAKHKAFAGLSDQQQKQLKVLSGILRLARVLRKCGVESTPALRVEKSAEAFFLRIPQLVDSEEMAARLAAGKYLLESCLDRPLILKPLPEPEKLPVPQTKSEEILHASAVAASD